MIYVYRQFTYRTQKCEQYEIGWNKSSEQVCYSKHSNIDKTICITFDCPTPPDFSFKVNPHIMAANMPKDDKPIYQITAHRCCHTIRHQKGYHVNITLH